MKIDIYNHVMTPGYLDLLRENSKDQGIVKRMTGIRVLWDIEARVEMLKQWPDLQQVLTLAVPPPEVLFGPDKSPHAARLANDEMYEIVRKYPDKFPCFVASVPMNNPDAAIAEMDRAITKLGAKGIQICTNVAGRPLDEPEFFPVFERVTKHHDLPIFMHPVRPISFADYKTEDQSKFEVWQVLGWPYETSVAMARMVFAGFFEKLPNMRLVTHHCGGMLPFFSGRAETLWAQLGSRSAGDDYGDILKRMSKPLIEYFKMFYGDTVLGGSASALQCGLDFFGPEHVVFASDCPFDPEGGPMFIREGMRSVEDLKLPQDVKDMIYFKNAQRLLKLAAK